MITAAELRAEAEQSRRDAEKWRSQAKEQADMGNHEQADRFNHWAADAEYWSSEFERFAKDREGASR